MISADKFIAVAEDVGLVVAVGKWVAWEACRQMQEWRADILIWLPQGWR